MNTRVDFRMPPGRGRNAKQGVNLRDSNAQCAAIEQYLEEHLGIAGSEGAFRLFPHPFRRQVFQFTRVDHLAHQRQSFIGHTKTEVGITRSKTRHAQYA